MKWNIMAVKRLQKTKVRRDLSSCGRNPESLVNCTDCAVCSSPPDAADDFKVPERAWITFVLEHEIKQIKDSFGYKLIFVFDLSQVI